MIRILKRPSIKAVHRGICDCRVRYFGPGNLTIPARWLSEPGIRSGDEICLFVTLAREGSVTAEAIHHMNEWVRVGFKVIVAVVSDLDDVLNVERLSKASGVMVRQNRGYDFGAWAALINRLPSLCDAALVATVNDSLIGPFDTFDAMLERVRALDADVIGATENHAHGRHLQSYLLFFKPRALRSHAWTSFWRKVKTGDRAYVIRNYELKFSSIMEKAGLRCSVLFSSDPEDITDQTLSRWEHLLELGFPYVKVSLIRDNPYGVDISRWQDRLSENDKGRHLPYILPDPLP